MQPSLELLKKIFSGQYFHPAYTISVDSAYEMRVHADGIFPQEMIENRRPHESEEVLAYRAKIWQKITKPHFQKVLTALNKIRRSSEWDISFDSTAVPTRIVPEETLESYLMNHYPRFTSITNWAFAMLLRSYAIDANGWIVVMPYDDMQEDNAYVRPHAVIFRSDQVIAPEEEQYLVIKSDEKCVYRSGSNEKYGDRYFIITDESWQTWDQTSDDRKFEMVKEIPNGIGKLPAFKMRGVIVSSLDEVDVQESRLSPMLPELNEALREYSDLQAEVVQHIYSEKWELSSEECDTCHGKGTRKSIGLGAHGEYTCNICGGSGKKPRGPFTTMYVPKQMAGETGFPIPPAGYVAKDTNIVETQDKRYHAHIFSALSSINMEFLSQAPIDQSGISKAFDADETNNFVHSVAEDIVAMMDDTIFFINEIRNSVVVADTIAREAMLPKIPVPERFDLFSAKVIGEELASAKEKKFNPVIINAMELGYATKKFSTDPEVRDRLELILSLDPLPNVPEDDKVVRLQNKGITKETYIISCNIQEFVNRAIEEDEDFYAKPINEQKDILKKYAKEIMDADMASPTNIIGGLPGNPDPNNPVDPNADPKLAVPPVPGSMGG